jgi:hypothetical protein
MILSLQRAFSSSIDICLSKQSSEDGLDSPIWFPYARRPLFRDMGMNGASKSRGFCLSAFPIFNTSVRIAMQWTKVKAIPTPRVGLSILKKVERILSKESFSELKDEKKEGS